MTIDPATGKEAIDPQTPAVDPTKNTPDPVIDPADDPDDKAPQAESPEAKSARLERMTDRHNKKHKLGKYAEGADNGKPADNSGELDYGQQAFLIANGIKEEGEMQIVQDVMKTTGKSLKEVIGLKYVQAELKEFRDAKATSAALPDGTQRRNGQSTRDTVEYWLAKGEMPPADQVQLRRDYVNARMKRESTGNVFAPNSLIR